MSELMTDRRTASNGRSDPGRRPTSPRVKTNWWLLLSGLVLAGAAVAAGVVAGIRPRLKHEGELHAAAVAVAEAIPRVPVVQAKAAAKSAERVLPGDSRPLIESAIYARTAGYLKSRRVDIGDRVEEGDLLAEIASPEVDAQLEQARATQSLNLANLERDRATSVLADAELTRSRRLMARQASTPQELEGFVARDRIAEANVKATESNLKVNEANIRRLEALQSFQKVIAPFSGIISARNLDAGDLISADTSTSSREMFHLVRTDTLRIFANVPQMFSTDVKVGQKAVVFRRDDPKRTFPGTVTRTANALDASTRTLLTEVQVANPDDALRPGMYLQVQVIFERQVPTVLVPAAALVTRSDGPRLAVLDGQNRLHYRAVQLGRDFGFEVEILAGIEVGETIVVNPKDELPEGTILQPIPLLAPKP